MPKDIEIIKAFEFDGETGLQVERDLTPEELADRKAVEIAYQARQSQLHAKLAARVSALAKLADLGLTAEEIAAL
jgi:hypothetical protein